jgi:hypothetical protein
MLGSPYRAVPWLFINQWSLDRELLSVVVDDNQKELGFAHGPITPAAAGAGHNVLPGALRPARIIARRARKRPRRSLLRRGRMPRLGYGLGSLADSSTSRREFGSCATAAMRSTASSNAVLMYVSRTKILCTAPQYGHRTLSVRCQHFRRLSTSVSMPVDAL